MSSLRKLMDEQHIHIFLNSWDLNNLANGWEVKAIVDHPDVFDDFYTKYPLEKIGTVDDYFLYFLSMKISTMEKLLPVLAQDAHKEVISTIAGQATMVVQKIGVGSVIKYINSHIQEIFDDEDTAFGISDVTMQFIIKYQNGIENSVFEFLCKNRNHLIIDSFDNLEHQFEKKPFLFEHLFPTGCLEEIENPRFEEVLEIWKHILQKKQSDLKGMVHRRIQVLFEDVKNLADSLTLDNVFYYERIVRHFNSFLKAIQSPLANDFLQYSKDTSELLDRYIQERGTLFQHSIPIGEIMEKLKKIENPAIRLLHMTHSFERTNEGIRGKSILDRHKKPEFSLLDMAATNIPTDDYFKRSHQQDLSFSAVIMSSVFMYTILNEKLRQDYIESVANAIMFIEEVTQSEVEHLLDDFEMMAQMIQLVSSNTDKSEITQRALGYGLDTFSCALTEKIMRIIYRYMEKDEMFIPIEKATLGQLLSESNARMVSLFGLDHIKNLSFFLQNVGNKRIGNNYRNSLAHWSEISTDKLTIQFTSELLWLFTDVLNTIYWYFSVINEKEQNHDQL